MKQNQSSSTAEGVALLRAIESSKPEVDRICYDIIARSLINGIKFTLSKLVINSGIYSRISPGAIEFIITRERYIDDFLKDCLSEELEQVVILGAGFDTRAYRIPGIETVQVFEIDHPATQEVKLKRLKKVIDPLPTHVSFIPVDFNTQTLAERLFASGYNEYAKTLFIWQGVTMYLSKEGVDSTLAFIANNSGTGSMVIFDYFYNETLEEMKMKTTGRITRTIGESLTFGIDKGRIEPFLTQRGFCDICNADTEELNRLYFTGLKAFPVISIGAAIVSARVNKENELMVQ